MKYLRQLYKIQLKDEALVDVGSTEERIGAERMFRGVEGDDNRRGELFGIANLLKYKDGAFMSYKTENKRGVQVVSTSSILSSIRGMSEEGLDELGGDGLIEGLDNTGKWNTASWLIIWLFPPHWFCF